MSDAFICRRGGSGLDNSKLLLADATAADVVIGKKFYSGDKTLKTGTMPSVVQATPSISVNSTTGLITASATQSGGKVTAGTKSATSQMNVNAGGDFNPLTYDRLIASAGTYMTGNLRIKGSSNLVAGNIKSGVTMFGVTGTLTDAPTVLTFATTLGDTSIQSQNFKTCKRFAIRSQGFSMAITEYNGPYFTSAFYDESDSSNVQIKFMDLNVNTMRISDYSNFVTLDKVNGILSLGNSVKFTNTGVVAWFWF